MQPNLGRMSVFLLTGRDFRLSKYVTDVGDDVDMCIQRLVGAP